MTGLTARAAARPPRYANHRFIQSFDIYNEAGVQVAAADYSIFSAGGKYLEARDMQGNLIENFDPRRAQIREAIEDEIYSTTPPASA